MKPAGDDAGSPIPPEAQPAVDRIKSEHRALARVIGAMQALVTHWRDPGVTREIELFEQILRYVAEVPDQIHHPKEDRHLFPALRACGDRAAALVDELEGEHARGAEAIGCVRGALDALRSREANALEGLAGAVEEFAEFYWWHMRKEEERILPLACQAVSPADWRAISAAFADNLDPLFGAQRSAHYEALYQRIVALTPKPLRSLLDG